MTDLHDLFDRHWAYLMHEVPELATMTGWPEGHDRWTDQSIDAVERRRRDASHWLDEAKTIDAAGLGEVARRSLEMFVAVEQAEVDAAGFPGAYLPIDQMEGVHLDPAFYLGIMGTDSTTEQHDVLARLAAVPEL